MARIARAKWAEMRAAYRRGEGSLREIAKRFGVDPSTVMRRSAREGWEAEREQAASRAQAKAAQSDVESLAAMLSKHRRIASRLLALAEGQLTEDAAGRVSASKLERIAAVLTKAARQERLAAGIEPSKPVMGFEAAAGGTVLRVKRQRDTEAPKTRPPAPKVA